MFSQYHVETVVQLSKGRWASGGRPFSADRSEAETISSQNVRVEFSLEDMDMSRFQQGATYEQISGLGTGEVRTSCDAPEYREDEAEMRDY